jgi:hypothetical protein
MEGADRVVGLFVVGVVVGAGDLVIASFFHIPVGVAVAFDPDGGAYGWDGTFEPGEESVGGNGNKDGAVDGDDDTDGFV